MPISRKTRKFLEGATPQEYLLGIASALKNKEITRDVAKHAASPAIPHSDLTSFPIGYYAGKAFEIQQGSKSLTDFITNLGQEHQLNPKYHAWQIHNALERLKRGHNLDDSSHTFFPSKKALEKSLGYFDIERPDSNPEFAKFFPSKTAKLHLLGGRGARGEYTSSLVLSDLDSDLIQNTFKDHLKDKKSDGTLQLGNYELNGTLMHKYPIATLNKPGEIYKWTRPLLTTLAPDGDWLGVDNMLSASPLVKLLRATGLTQKLSSGNVFKKQFEPSKIDAGTSLRITLAALHSPSNYGGYAPALTYLPPGIKSRGRGAAEMAAQALQKGKELHPDYEEVLKLFPNRGVSPVIEKKLIIDFYTSLILEEI